MSAPPPLAERLARWVVDLDAAAIPSRAVEVARLQVLDQLGVQLLGSTMPHVAPVRRLVAGMGAAPESTVVGSGTRTVPAYAAYVNGTLASSCEFDDVHMNASHPGAYVVPAALAVGERVEASGAEVITALVGGVQVMALLGSAALRGAMHAGWHVPKLFGTFGATAAAGRLLGLTATQLTNAFGIAGSDVSGTVEPEFAGGEVKRLHAGSAGRNGVQAAQLALDGFTGPASVVDGDHGLFAMFGTDVDPSAVDRGWDRFQIVDTVFRLHPTVGSAAPVLDGLRHLLDEHAFTWRDVQRVRLGLPSFAVEGAQRVVRPVDAVSAQFSTAFGVALLLVRGGNRPQDYFDPALWNDSAVAAVLDRVVVHEHDFGQDVPALSAAIEVELADGRVLSHRQLGFRGHPDSPATDDADVETKFRANVEGILAPAAVDRVVELVDGLAGLHDVGELMRTVG